MPTDKVKARIQSVYRQLLESRELTPRYGQRQMIAEITGTLAVLADERVEENGSEPPISVVEAGTGTGKTLAYLLAVIPLAQELGYRVIVATATVALQEQIMLKDIPEILEGSDLQFSHALAKGRGRYLCLSKLDMALRGGDSRQAMMDLYSEELEEEETGDRALYEDMMRELNSGSWRGDRDDWKQPIAEHDWRPLTVDKYQCSGSKCSHFRNCCFYRARNSLDKSDCIVANHDLVLTDLALGGGAILPAPEQCIYIFDEAHHLPFKSNSHFSSFTQIRGSSAWLEGCENLLQALAKEDFVETGKQGGLQKVITELRENLEQVWLLLEQFVESQTRLDRYESSVQHVFEMGVVPAELREMAGILAGQFSRLCRGLQNVADKLQRETDQAADMARAQLAEHRYPLVGGNIMRAEANLDLWSSYAAEDPLDTAPHARWLSVIDSESRSDIDLASSPVLAADSLQERLWQSCGGAVLTSATLSALGRFDMLKLRAGLPEHTRYLSIPSPFDFNGAATLVVPRMNCDPSDTGKHTALIVKALPRLLQKDSAAMMLFSSRRQMQEVLRSLPQEWRELVLCQDDYQKAQLIKYHRQRVDRGEGSIIFGLASFTEGVDLPGEYCTHVLIAKIPFAVPNDPIETTLSAWVQQQGMNPFMTLAVPDAAFRLVQASGRLLRSESDRGQITLFDERIVNRRYGKQILDSLPPYRRQVFEQEITG